APSAESWSSPELRALFSLPAPRWPVECEVIQERIKHIEWVPPEPEPFCPPMGPEQALDTLSEEQGIVVYHSSPSFQGSCFTCAQVGGAPGPLSLPAALLEGPQDTTLLLESLFESGTLQKAMKVQKRGQVGPYAYVLTLQQDLCTAKHTQWFYFCVQNTCQELLYHFTVANMAKPKSLYSQGLQLLLYSQQDAQSHGIGWHQVGIDICSSRGCVWEPPAFWLSWTVPFPHNSDTCFFAACYPYTYSDLQCYLHDLAVHSAHSRYCAVQMLCHSLASNTVYLLTITGPRIVAGKQVVVTSACMHPSASSSSWTMRGFLDFLLSTHTDAQLLRHLFIFEVVPMFNPNGVLVGNSHCSLVGQDPNRAYGTALPGSFPVVWHLRAMVQRVLSEQEVVLYCDFHEHSWKNNIFTYGCNAGGDSARTRLCQRLFPLMLSKNTPDELSFASCKFQVQKSKEGMGRVSMWHLGVSLSYTLEVAFSGSTLSRKSSHFSIEDLKSLDRLLCDTLLDFCNPEPTKVGSDPAQGVLVPQDCGDTSAIPQLQQCLVEVDALLQWQVGHKPGSGGSWSDVSPSELESRTELVPGSV
ncbi:CBPC2 carboxypeptidase, partial [Pardalotus punctatus]|nr:CBPC2 carboxypeptidase [Pardalotus punctatus]